MVSWFFSGHNTQHYCGDTESAKRDITDAVFLHT